MGEQLLWAVKNGESDVVKKIITDSKVDVNAELMNGRMAIHYAADYGHDDVISVLIQLKADVNLPDKFGITPLLAAIYEGHTECVKLLIAKGANKKGKAPDGSSYKDCAESDEIKDLL